MLPLSSQESAVFPKAACGGRPSSVFAVLLSCGWESRPWFSCVRSSPGLFLSTRVTDEVFNFLLVWYYCTLTIRESILISNGSSGLLWQIPALPGLNLKVEPRELKAGGCLTTMCPRSSLE